MPALLGPNYHIVLVSYYTGPIAPPYQYRETIKLQFDNDIQGCFKRSDVGALSGVAPVDRAFHLASTDHGIVARLKQLVTATKFVDDSTPRTIGGPALRVRFEGQDGIVEGGTPDNREAWMAFKAELIAHVESDIMQ